MKVTYLLDIKHNDGESNKKFITRLKRVVATIEDAHDLLMFILFAGVLLGFPVVFRSIDKFRSAGGGDWRPP